MRSSLLLFLTFSVDTLRVAQTLSISQRAAEMLPGRTWDEEFDAFVQDRMSLLKEDVIDDQSLDAAYMVRLSAKAMKRGDRIRVAIVNNTVYGKFHNTVFHYRHHAFFEGLLDLVRSRKLPDVEFVAHMADVPGCQENEEANGLPVLSWAPTSKCHDIPVPCWTLMKRTYREVSEWQYDALVKKSEESPFETRKARLAWDLGRGHGYHRDEGRKLLGRDHIDDLPHNAGEYEKYQFSAHMDGATYSARFKNIFLKGSIPVYLKLDGSSYSEYWHHWLEPNKHYVHVDAAQRNAKHVQNLLKERFSQSLAENALMASSGSSIVKDLLRPDRVFQYMERLFRAYAVRQNFTLNAQRLQRLSYVQITNDKLANVRNKVLQKKALNNFADEVLEGFTYMTEAQYREV